MSDDGNSFLQSLKQTWLSDEEGPAEDVESGPPASRSPFLADLIFAYRKMKEGTGSGEELKSRIKSLATRLAAEKARFIAKNARNARAAESIMKRSSLKSGYRPVSTTANRSGSAARAKRVIKARQPATFICASASQSIRSSAGKGMISRLRRLSTSNKLS